MPRTKARNFCERERDALALATASDDDIRKLCRALGDDPNDRAEHVRRLLLDTARAARVALKPERTPAPALPLPETGLLPLHRILLLDDNTARLAQRIEEFRLHQFTLGIVVDTVTNGQDALTKLQHERFDAILIDIEAPTGENSRAIAELRNWSTPLAPILLNSAGMEALELRSLNRNVIRALATSLGKPVPRPYQKKGPGREASKKPCQNALFELPDTKKTGTT